MARHPGGERGVPLISLGADGPQVSRIGLGLAALGRPAYITSGRAEDLPERTIAGLRAQTFSVLDAAYEAGIRYVDVARSYGRAEEFLSGWLAGPGHGDLVVGSKWGYRYTGDWRLEADQHEVKEHSLAMFTAQLAETRALLGDRLALYQVHSLTLESPLFGDPALLAALGVLRDSGVIVGLTTSGPHQADTLRRALDVRVGGQPLFAAAQVTWNLLEPSVGAAAAEAAAAGWAVLVKEALANGRLAPAEKAERAEQAEQAGQANRRRDTPAGPAERARRRARDQRGRDRPGRGARQPMGDRRAVGRGHPPATAREPGRTDRGRRAATGPGGTPRRLLGRACGPGLALTTKEQAVEMPWFPDFASAVELARVQTRAAGQADPVMQYFTALNEGDTHALETVWPGEVVIYDPRAGEVRGHRQLRRFVSRNQAWLAERHARTERVAATRAGGRAVVELLAHLDRRRAGRGLAARGRRRIPGRSLGGVPHLLQPMAGRRAASRQAADPRAGARHPGDVVGRYQAALDAGDTDAIVATFAPDGYLREPIGPHSAHRGAGELRSYFSACFSAGGGIGLQHCVVTDDGMRCALEYNCVRWGSHDLPPQAGIGVYERGPDGLLAAARSTTTSPCPPDAPEPAGHGARPRRPVSGRRSGRRRCAGSRR